MGNRQRSARKGPEALRAEIARKTRLKRIGLVVAGLAIVGVTALLFSTKDSAAPPSGRNLAEGFAGGPVSLVFADFTPGEDATVLRFGVDSEEEEKVATLPRSSTTTSSLTSRWVTMVELDRRQGTAVPVLYLFDPEAEKETEVGPGVGPAWKADGSAVAYAEPVDIARCNVVDCPGDKKVNVLDPATGESETLIEGPYQILFWAGDLVLVFDTRSPGETIALAPDGSATTLDLRSSRVWGASPDGRWLVASDDTGTRFIELAADGGLGEEIETDIPAGSILGAGGWAFDSSVVAAVVESIEEPRVVLFSPSEPRTEVVAEGLGSITRVLWSPDNEGLFLTTVQNGIGGSYCSLGGDCRELDFNGEARLPLRLE